MQQDKKWFAKNDELLLADKQTDYMPNQKTYVPKPGEKISLDKAMTKDYINPDKNRKTKRSGETVWRWTEIQQRYNSVKNRLFDNLPKARDSLKDYEPLYSSFTKDKVFHAPKTAKEVVKIKSELRASKQKEEPK